MFKKALLYSVMIGLMLNNPAFAQKKVIKLTPRQAIYHYAKSGNIKALQRLKAQGYNIDLTDAKGLSALCEAVWKKDKTAISSLLQAGAKKTNSCLENISEEVYNHFLIKAADYSVALIFLLCYNKLVNLF